MFVIDKKGNLLSNTDVILHIEGAPMTSWTRCQWVIWWEEWFKQRTGFWSISGEIYTNWEKILYNAYTCNITRKIHDVYDEQLHGYFNYSNVESIKELFLQL